MIEQKEIVVWDYKNIIKRSADPIKYEVKAWCMADFRAYFFIDDFLCEAHGDDGHWWIVYMTHKHWVSAFKETVASIKEE